MSYGRSGVPLPARIERGRITNVPAGVEHGMLLRLAGQGEAGPQGAPPGDLLVRIYIQPHATLKRDGDDLY